MKSLTHYIQEKLIIKKNKRIDYKYFPQKKEELKAIINQRIDKEGNEVDLNDIDVSKITNMISLFENLKDFNGDISNWDVSNVTNMNYMFYSCKAFNQDISKWDISNVTSIKYMFYECESFNQDISSWDVSRVTNMANMFYGAKSFNQDISNWNVSKVKDYYFIFRDCDIQEKYKPKFI